MPSNDDETRPLLRPQSPSPASLRSQPATIWLHPSGPRCVALIVFFFFLIGITSNMFGACYPEIWEQILCRQFYDDVTDTRADPRCKNADVQGEIALIDGVGGPIAFASTVLTSVFYGEAADRYGRKVILLLAVLGSFIFSISNTVIFYFPEIFPLRLIWVASLGQFIGGGASIIRAMLYTMVSDVTVETQRSTIYFWLVASEILGALTSRPVAYTAMRNGPWLANWIALGTHTLEFLVPLAMPETLPTPKAEADPTDAVGGETATAANGTSRSKDDSWRSGIQRLTSSLMGTFSSIRIIFAQNPKLAMVLTSTIFTTTGLFIGEEVLMLYITKRYGYEWREANVILAIKTILEFATVAAILPLAGTLLIKYGRSTALSKDLWIARFSLLVAILGLMSIGLAQTKDALKGSLAVSALSKGLEGAVRSVLATLAGNNVGSGVLFSAYSVFHGIGMFVSGPIMAVAFRAGLSLGGKGLGLPLWISAGLIVPGAILLFVIRDDDAGKAERARPGAEEDEI